MIGLEFLINIYGFKNKNIAESLDISSVTVHDWIKGKRKIPLARIKQLSKMFDGIPEEYFQKELDEVDKLNIQKLKIKQDIKDNPIIVGYDPQLTMFGEGETKKDELGYPVFSETPIYLGQSELKELDKKCQYITKGRVKEAFLKMEDEEDKKNIILELIELLEDDDSKREIIIEGLKYFGDGDTLEELKEKVTSIVLDD